jgi:hypothetical protein
VYIGEIMAVKVITCSDVGVFGWRYETGNDQVAYVACKYVYSHNAGTETNAEQVCLGKTL